MKEDDIRHIVSPRMRRFVLWQNDSAKIEETDFDTVDVLSGLQSLALCEELSPEAYDFVMALFLAAGETHPKFRLKVEKPKAGSMFSRINTLETASVAREMTSEVDISVAKGMKQEAAIQDAMAKYSLSRREVFRRLQSVRRQRAAYHEFAISEGSIEVLAGIPQGFVVASDGRLVPSDQGR